MIVPALLSRMSAALCVVSTLACSAPERSDPDTTLASELGPAPATASSRCYMVAGSVLGRRPGDAGAPPSSAPAWLRLDQVTSADSGPALLLDGDRASLAAGWRRLGRDSVVVNGMSDFVRVQLRLALADSLAAGRGLASSDATQEPDSAGRMRDYRREYGLAAGIAPCDEMPRPANEPASAR